MEPPREFPNIICWSADSRAEVMNTMALDVDAAVFAATHYPSLLQQQGAAEGTFLPLLEDDYIQSFLDSTEPHVLDVAVGDSGTGKSHFIKWLYNKVMAAENPRLCVKLIARSSANLAEVVSSLLRDFQGPRIDELKNELQRAGQQTTLRGAGQRVLDEYASLLDPANHQTDAMQTPADVDPQLYSDVLELLPAFLHDMAIRQWLLKDSRGIVQRLARHATGRREQRADDPNETANLVWTESDLAVPTLVYAQAGKQAKELASNLFTDDDIRKVTARILNDAFGDTLNNLLGLKRGDLKAAMRELRRQIRVDGRELVLLIEDMSVAHGLDRDLLESLFVRTRDEMHNGGAELCKLRSIVGVTHDDYSRMVDNVRSGRVRKTLFFNVRFSLAASGQTGEVGRREVMDFASRYLNATRYGLESLRAWQNDDASSELASYCISSRCPNVSRCHSAFGEVDGRGLYPFNEEAIARLYDRAAAKEAVTGHRTGAERAFNPRLMVAGVLNRVLEEGERSISRATFPSPELIDAFGSKEVGNATRVGIEDTLRDNPSESERLLAALELYSPRPDEGQLNGIIREAFDLPLVKVRTQPRVRHEPEPDRGKQTDPRPDLDPFDQWANGQPLEQSHLNIWRSLVYDAVAGTIDWDQPGLAVLNKEFEKPCIYFVGQVPRQAQRSVKLEIDRSPQVGLALRGLRDGFRGRSEDESSRMVELAGRYVRIWSEQVVEQLRAIEAAVGSIQPLELAASYLAVGAMTRGEVPPNASDSELLAAIFKPWPTEDPSGSPAWTAMWKAHRQYGSAARDLLKKTIACSKNAAMGECVDPTRILVALRGVRSGNLPPPLPAAADQWSGHFQPIRKLAEEVARYIEPAIHAERELASEWLVLAERLVGSYSFSDLCRKLQKVAEAAAAEELVHDAGFSKTCERMGRRSASFKECLEAIQKFAAVGDESGPQLRILSQLDRQWMAETMAFLHDAEEMMTDACKSANAPEFQRTGDIDGAVRQIDQRLKSLAEDIGRLLGDTTVSTLEGNLG